MTAPESASVLLVTQYDGSGFSGWQRQPDVRTVQGDMEQTLHRLCGVAVTAVAAGRTDAGVHAHGQGVGVKVPPKWTPGELRRALNATLPPDVWVAEAHAMHPAFHPRFSAERRRYAYVIGTDEAAMSPFRRRTEWALRKPLDLSLLNGECAALLGEHTFRAFAIQGTAPADDDHRCLVHVAQWRERPGGVVFDVEANRFLHHMVRFLVGTMVEVATGRRPMGAIAALLDASDNSNTSPPAPPHGLFFESVTYPQSVYLSPA